MKRFLFYIGLAISLPCSAQELFVNSESASLVPAGSINLKIGGHFVEDDRIYARSAQRYIPEVMAGVSKHLTLTGGITFSNMHTYQFKNEAFLFEAKYRLLSVDDFHGHFRLSALFSGSLTKAPFHYDEADLFGDKSGFQLSLLATRLWNRFALAGTIGHLQAIDRSRFNDVVYLPKRNFQFITYSLSSGYLVAPKVYKSFNQLNVNVYLEVLGELSLDQPKQLLDIAPAIQLIFFSSLKVNVSYRLQAISNMDRMTSHSLNVSMEKSFLGIMHKKREGLNVTG